MSQQAAQTLHSPELSSATQRTVEAAVHSDATHISHAAVLRSAQHVSHAVQLPVSGLAQRRAPESWSWRAAPMREALALRPCGSATAPTPAIQAAMTGRRKRMGSSNAAAVQLPPAAHLPIWLDKLLSQSSMILLLKK